MIKMVVTDMDGTLLGDRSEISDKNLQAIRLLEKNHIEFAIASGRGYDGAHAILDQYDVQCEAILGNGAQYCDQNGHVLMNCYLDKKMVSDIVSIFEKAHLPYIIFTTQGFYTGQDSKWVRNMFVERCVRKFQNHYEEYEPDGKFADVPCNHLCHYDNLEDFLALDLEIIKIEVFSLHIDDIVKVKESLKTVSHISYLSSFEDNVEVTDIHAQKGIILEKIIALKGYHKDEIVVLGDGMNDITMFERFPYSFAPTNAVQEIQNLAYCIVNSCEKDGFAQAVEIALKDLGN